MMTTKSTIPTSDWSLKNTPIKVDYKQYSYQTIASVAGVFLENGVDLIMTFNDSIDQDKFDQFITALRRKYRGQKVALFMD